MAASSGCAEVRPAWDTPQRCPRRWRHNGAMNRGNFGEVDGEAGVVVSRQRRAAARMESDAAMLEGRRRRRSVHWRGTVAGQVRGLLDAGEDSVTARFGRGGGEDREVDNVTVPREVVATPAGAQARRQGRLVVAGGIGERRRRRGGSGMG
uniref:DUF834 domain-containing protein n=1 Tax=Oryza barthii TaxID=65489 RepID=A0A0D3GPS0_9ORYZ